MPLMATRLLRHQVLWTTRCSAVIHLSTTRELHRRRLLCLGLKGQAGTHLKPSHSKTSACTPCADSVVIAPFKGLACQQWRGLRRKVVPAAAAAAGTDYQDEPLPPWRKVVAVTAGCLLLCSLHRNTFSVLLPDLCAQLGLRSSQAGAVQAATLTAYLAGQVPAGILADRYGGNRVLLLGLTIWSAATALTAAAGYGVAAGSNSSNWWPLAVIFVSRALMGLASACVMPCVTATAVKWVPMDQRTSMISFVYANFHIGGVIGLTMVPLVADALGGEAAFLVSGALGIIWAVCGAVIMTQVHTAVTSVQQDTAVTVNAPQPSNQIPLPEPHHHQRMKQDSVQGSKAPQQQRDQRQGFSWRIDAGSWRQIALLCYAHAVIGLGFFIMQNFIPLLLASLGSNNLALTGRLSSMPWLAAAVVGMMTGSAADSLIRNGLPTLLVRRLMQGLSFLGCGLSVLPLALNPNIGLMPAVWCLTANLTCYSLSYGGFQSYLQDVAGKDAGVVQGLTNSASTIMGIFGSLLTGWVVEATGTYSAVFWLLGLLYGSAAVVWCLCTSSHKLQTAGNVTHSQQL